MERALRDHRQGTSRQLTPSVRAPDEMLWKSTSCRCRRVRRQCRRWSPRRDGGVPPELVALAGSRSHARFSAVGLCEKRLGLPLDRDSRGSRFTLGCTLPAGDHRTLASTEVPTDNSSHGNVLSKLTCTPAHLHTCTPAHLDHTTSTRTPRECPQRRLLQQFCSHNGYRESVGDTCQRHGVHRRPQVPLYFLCAFLFISETLRPQVVLRSQKCMHQSIQRSLSFICGCIGLMSLRQCYRWEDAATSLVVPFRGRQEELPSQIITREKSC